MEINNKEFKRAFRGYDLDEVDDFLEQVVEDYEKLFKENATLREKISALQEKLDHYTKIEATMQNTLIMAQGAAEQVKANSQKEAELIIKNANDTAQKIIDQAHTEAVRIAGEYERIKQEFQLFKSRYKTFIQTQLDLLSELDTVTGEPDVKQLKDSQSQSDIYGKSFGSDDKFNVAFKGDVNREAKFGNENETVSNFESSEDLVAADKIEYKPGTIKFDGKPKDFSLNFDDFDDDDTF